MYRILVSDKLGDAGLELLQRAEDATYDLKTGLSKDELRAIVSEYDALIIRSGTKVDRSILEAASNLKVIGRAGIGVDNVDIETATRRGIIVTNTPAANAITTAEQAITMMLAVSRHTAAAHASLGAGKWERSRFVGQELYGKVLGIIGFGGIGRLVAERARGLGMEIIAYDPYVSEDIGRRYDTTLVDLDDLLAQSDYISLHATITPETEKMLDRSAIMQMKDGVIIVNGARGKLIDEEALAEALKSGRVRAAAVDVYSIEPPMGNPLIGLPNVLHTPHLGASTVEAQRAVATQIVDQVLDALRGKDYRNALNMPFSAGPEFAALRPYMELAEKLGTMHAGLALAPIRRIEIEVRGETGDILVRPAAAALLKGLLQGSVSVPINYINAPVLAEDNGISVSQSKGMDIADYPNIISCRAIWDGGQRLLAGVLFGGTQPRVVQVDDYNLDARPEGIVLLIQNQDVPGVIGQVGTILASGKINIGEWRMGRLELGGEALSFINLDNEPQPDVLESLEKIPAVTGVRIVKL